MPIGNLRLRNLFPPIDIGPRPMDEIPRPNVGFGGLQEPQYVPQIPPFQLPQMPIEDDWTARFEQLYQPETTNIDRVNQLLGQMPQRGKPRWLDRIAGALAGISHGPAAQEQRMYAPYLRQMKDWETKFEPARQAAGLERQENINRRMLAQNIAQREHETKKLGQQEELKRTDLGIKQQRADVYEWRAKNPQMKLAFPKGGNVVGVNPITGETVPILGSNGLPISTGTMTEKDKIDLQFQGDVQLTDVKGAQRLEQIAAQGKETRKTQAESPLGTTIQNIPDINDPNKLTAAWVNPRKKTVEPVVSEGKQVGPVHGKISGGLKQPTNIEAIQGKAQQTLDSLRSMLTSEGNLQPDVAATVGGSRLLMGRYLPTTESRKGETRINNLKANLVLDLIADMKAQSKTGATGFGALNLKELGTLEAAASRLDPGLSEKDFADALREVESKLQKIIQGKTGKLTPEELIKKYGGQ